ncbi:RNA polymerase sigma factor [Paracoccus xiamenensis]|uniref:RNA polymerase sigma factor n=1 Tax=Paracoccus xiamenensis TaxID=2714901 RepID=UPI001408F66C|nr:RNA polymerase sigma factor [Paracoccus xiamenensis]NHF74455.1 RNA polymerase sigma factor [Paracoccus xiamenensis]
MSWNLKNLFRRYSDEIKRGFIRRGHGVDEAADLTQDVFLRLIKAEVKADLVNPGAYLHQIARNLSIDSRRSAQYAHIVDSPSEVVEAIADPSPGQDANLLYRQRMRTIEKALLDLPVTTRRAFELYQLEGMTMSQTAEAIGLSVSRTWTLVQRAYKALREALDDADALMPSSGAEK